MGPWMVGRHGGMMSGMGFGTRGGGWLWDRPPATL